MEREREMGDRNRRKFRIIPTPTTVTKKNNNSELNTSNLNSNKKKIYTTDDTVTAAIKRVIILGLVWLHSFGFNGNE